MNQSGSTTVVVTAVLSPLAEEVRIAVGRCYIDAEGSRYAVVALDWE